MAIYKIAALNYMTTGSKRTLVNLDTQMVYRNPNNIYILSREEDGLSNVVTEQYDFNYLPAEYIEKEHPINNIQDQYPDGEHRPVSGDYHSPATEPLSEEEKLSSIILNECQKYGYDSSLSDYMRILLQTSHNTQEMLENLHKFRRHQTNRTFVIEDRSLADGFHDRNTWRNGGKSSANYVYSMYDIRDVSIKSRLLKLQQNMQLRTSNDYLGKFVDIYCPDLSSQPLGFCQVNNDAYVMTDSVRRQPYIVNTSIIKDREGPEVDDYYDISLTSKGIDTYLYRSADDLGASSLYQVLSDGSSPVQVFTPSKSMVDVDYNMLVVVDQQENESKYELGDIYAQQLDIAKNVYDSLYSMNISASPDGTIHANKCRQYCGVMTDGQNVYLKYYDNRNYVPVSSNGGSIPRYAMGQSGDVKYPFQKVETYIPNNFEMRCKHKSNLFSINIKNKRIEELLDETIPEGEKAECEELYRQIHKEIKNSIKTIADNICPVNTQFFDVYFDK